MPPAAARAVTSVAGGEVAPLPGAVERLVRFADEGRGAMGPTHDYTADGLRRVGDALAAVRDRAPASMDVDARVREIRERADAMQRDPTSTAHALQAREALLLATTAIRQMRPNASGALDDRMREAQDAARAVDPQVRLLEQGERVERAFSTSAAALRQLAR